MSTRPSNVSPKMAKTSFAARGITEAFEELKFVIERGGAEDDGELLEQVLEKARRLAIFAFVSSKKIEQ